MCLCYLNSVNILIRSAHSYSSPCNRMQIIWWFNRLTVGILCLSELKKYQRCFKVLKWEKKRKEIIGCFNLLPVLQRV